MFRSSGAGPVTGQDLAGIGMDSPCIQVCVMDAQSGLCAGCGRTLAEIAAWGTLAPAERRRIMALLPERRRAAQPEGHAAVSSAAGD